MRIRILALAGLCGIAGLVFESCGPKQTTATPGPAPETAIVMHSRPANLKLFPGDRKMTVQWKVVGTEVISGFDIYIVNSPEGKPESRDAMDGAKPFNPQVYPGDTNPDDSVEEFTAEDLVNGTKYSVWVRIVRPDGSLSDPTEIRTAVCGPRGEFNLGLRYRSDNDGYSLFKNKVVKADASENDLYFYEKDGVTYLASPSLLNGYLRVTKFGHLKLGGTLEEIRDSLPGQRSAPTESKIPIQAGEWVWLVTADGYNAVVQVQDIKGHEAQLRYALCPLAGEMSF